MRMQVELRACREPKRSSDIIAIEIAQSPWGERNDEWQLSFIATSWSGSRDALVGTADRRCMLALAHAALVACGEEELASLVEDHQKCHLRGT